VRKKQKKKKNTPRRKNTKKTKGKTKTTQRGEDLLELPRRIHASQAALIGNGKRGLGAKARKKVSRPRGGVSGRPQISKGDCEGNYEKDSKRPGVKKTPRKGTTCKSGEKGKIFRTTTSQERAGKSSKSH